MKIGTPQVVTGLDRILGEGPSLARLPPGARVGLLAHAASVDRGGRNAVEALAAGCDLELVRIFAPEHGLWGHEQDMESVGTAVDRATGLPVVSLYGDTPESLSPDLEALRGLDAVICDLQDVGSRYYTFVYTVSYMMEAAAKLGLPVVVLDRPNPIGGLLTEGPILEPSLASFVGRYALPVRHGMTIGELASMFAGAFGADCDLRVVEMLGWERSMQFEATGLPWVPPSPNMPTPQTAHVYPGGCLIEGTNLSEGRGTTLPFELIGAPWLPELELAESLRRCDFEGVVFRAASFRPMFQKHAGASCQGVQVIVDDPRLFRPFAVYLELIRQARRIGGGAFAWRTEVYEFETERLAIDLLLGRAELRGMLESAAPLSEIEQTWQEPLAAFLDLRQPFLRY